MQGHIFGVRWYGSVFWYLKIYPNNNPRNHLLCCCVSNFTRFIYYQRLEIAAIFTVLCTTHCKQYLNNGVSVMPLHLTDKDRLSNFPCVFKSATKSYISDSVHLCNWKSYECVMFWEIAIMGFAFWHNQSGVWPNQSNHPANISYPRNN